MDWFFDGLGTMLIGLVVGATGGGVVSWKIATSKTSHRISQKQRARDGATQVQVAPPARGVDD